MKPKSLIFSRGILAIPHLHSFLPDVEMVTKSFLGSPQVDQVLGWGFRPSTQKARGYAAKHQLPYVALEDGFLRSLGLGVQGYAPFSMVVDDLGIYYATEKSSRLEQLILDKSADDGLLQQAETALELICGYQLSKYNHAPDFVPPITSKDIVLVIDQTFGDMAVKYGQADAASFQDMLQSAVTENPDAEIWVKTHPDVISGKKKGYLTALSTEFSQVRLLAQDISPLSLLKQVDKVYCVTSQMGFEALLVGKPVVTFGVPWFAGWRLTDDRHPQIRILQQQQRRADRTLLQLFAAAYLQYSRYINPNNGEVGTIFEVIDYLHQATLLNQRLRGHLYCIGMSLWKRAVIKPFFRFPGCRLHFVSSLDKLRKIPLKKESRLLIWSQGKPELLAYAEQQQIPLLRMEDGFIRSVGLGSNLVAPLSLVIDDLGIYFNAQSPSRLEDILQTQAFSEQDLHSAEQLRQHLIAANIGKYNIGDTEFSLDSHNKKSILVPGQVEDDASIRFGSPQIKSNLELLQQVRLNNPDAYIVYKPHPDVLSGNRVGAIKSEMALQYADKIVENINILQCIQQVDEVHTMTSLAGFEALLRHKTVHCYGLPFYANWGLTFDHLSLARRQRKLNLAQLISGVLVYYPQYVAPNSGKMIDVQTAIDILQQQKNQLQGNGLQRHWMKKQLTKLKHLYLTLK
ncbi:capsular polysaccharide biosynthesis protein [Testudinibacter sp. TR-2022]|uniref:capsular polysaccharide biosynthesis protein n=1 Tax=Testudinibacter sp. TR-2022 TaxID=2585029 RepID=UPI00111AD219|nr:capsular polysaccharide biosynthesis protein [Testudinibacter sp. TR-2022]TNH03982.1 capsular polysaccharide biosynthesis protein [Pasteurellaceae bacterium Phil11]TNH19464.1 capsular polysaccharide biosynthesis protein [Testudinibacter sp. TR-2022]TNH28958.1 capsular polysaccharide biosynthesis protein [Testudinibacter sp. TR-2022]